MLCSVLNADYCSILIDLRPVTQTVETTSALTAGAAEIQSPPFLESYLECLQGPFLSGTLGGWTFGCCCYWSWQSEALAACYCEVWRGACSGSETLSSAPSLFSARGEDNKIYASIQTKYYTHYVHVREHGWPVKVGKLLVLQTLQTQRYMTLYIHAVYASGETDHCSASFKE